MNRLSTLILFALLPLSLAVPAVETNTELAIIGQAFNSSDNSDAADQRLGLNLQTRLTHNTKSGNGTFVFQPFVSWDQRDDERNHTDIRELNYLHAFDNWEVQAGIGKVFWGVAESNHLVDVINQTDALEGIDGEDKLGQPMLRVSRLFEQSTLEFFALPGFRERAFLGPDSRFYLGLPIDDDKAQFQSDDGDNHVDYALRLSGYAGDLDYGVAYFDGTSREPSFIPGNEAGSVFLPYYAQMQQWSVDAQYTKEAWLWKLEALNNEQSSGSYSAAVAGLEYTFFGLRDGVLDTGVLLELHQDSRDDATNVLLQNDVFIGTRLAFNDEVDTALLVGGFVDLDDESTSLRVEGSRRVLTDAKLSIEGQIFGDIDPENRSFGFKDNDYIQLELQLFF